LVRAEELCRSKGIELIFVIEPFAAKHPNTYRMVLSGSSGRSVAFTALSTGGGIIRLVELDGHGVSDDRDYINPLMPVSVAFDPILPFADIDGLLRIVNKDCGNLSEYALIYEAGLGSFGKEEVLDLAGRHLQVMAAAVATGLAGTGFKDRILPRQSHLLVRNPRRGQLIPAPLTNAIIRSVTAIMETKSSMGLIVAAPTAGSCGTLAGTLLSVAEMTAKNREERQKALLAAGMVGVFIAQQGGFAAEEGGCQYECGAASGMTAAALVELMGGDAMMSLHAASMAMQNTMGLICDPVADRVEVPCLGKNIMAALNALAAANMVIAGFDHVIPLKEVITAMKEVGEGMSPRYRCTCRGGLSIAPEALKIQKKLNAAIARPA
jgi:L-serine dehydratase